MIFGVLLRDKDVIQLGDVMMTVKLHSIYAIIRLEIIVNIFLLDIIHSILLLSIFLLSNDDVLKSSMSCRFQITLIGTSKVRRNEPNRKHQFGASQEPSKHQVSE